MYNPFQCCDSKLEVKAPKSRDGVQPLALIAADGKDGDWYTVEAPCCQPGFFCHCPCGKCKEIVWEISPAGGGDPVGQIKKV